MAVCAFPLNELSSPSISGVAPLASLSRPACLESTSLLMSEMSWMRSVSAVSRVWEDFTAASFHLQALLAVWEGVLATQTLRLTEPGSLGDGMGSAPNGVPMEPHRGGPTVACPCIIMCMAGEIFATRPPRADHSLELRYLTL